MNSRLVPPVGAALPRAELFALEQRRVEHAEAKGGHHGAVVNVQEVDPHLVVAGRAE